VSQFNNRIIHKSFLFPKKGRLIGVIYCRCRNCTLVKVNGYPGFWITKTNNRGYAVAKVFWPGWFLARCYMVARVFWMFARGSFRTATPGQLSQTES